MAWAYLGLRAVLVLSRCVSYCAAVSPCIAVVTDIWRTESGRSQRFTEPLAPPDLRCWPSSVQGQPGAEDHWWSTVWPNHSPPDPGPVALHCATTPGSGAMPDGPAHGWPSAATGHG